MSMVAGDLVPQRAVGLELRHRRGDRRASARRRSCCSPDRRRLLLGESVALSALAFVLLGGVAVGGVPTPGAYAAFARGLVDGWADLLSSAPPADITEQLRALPFTVAWLAAADRRRDRPPLAAARPPGDRPDPRPRPEPAVHDRGALAGPRPGRRHPRRHAAAHRRRPALRARTWPSPPTPTSSTPAAVATNRARLMLGAAVDRRRGASPRRSSGPHLPLAEANERFDLRRYQVPPFDPLAVPSPLAEVKASLKDDRKRRRRVRRRRRHARSTAGRSP